MPLIVRQVGRGCEYQARRHRWASGVLRAEPPLPIGSLCCSGVCGDLLKDFSTGMGRVDVALEEYKALRAESLSHQQAQTTIVNVALTATAAIGGIAFGTKGSGDERVEILLVLPIVLCGLGLSHLNHTYGALRLGQYVRDCLWPALQAAEPGDSTGSIRIPSWEEEAQKGRRARAFFSPRGWLGWLPNLLIFAIPSVASLALNWDARPGADNGSDLSAAWVAGLVAVVSTVWLTALVGWSHRARTRKATEQVVGTPTPCVDSTGEPT